MKIEINRGAKDGHSAYVYDNEGLPQYRKTYMLVKDATNKPVASFAILLMYPFCCGMREIGGFSHGWDTIFRPTAEQALELLQCFYDMRDLPGLECIGALTLTEHGSRNSFQSYLPVWVVSLLSVWPEASHGDWFYNPNSGNVVRQWTLPFPKPVES